MEGVLLTPEDLLLVTVNDYDDLLCVGEEGDHYCERSLTSPGVIRTTTYREVRRLLRVISATSSFHDLNKLARLCLCNRHAFQAYDIASIWKETLRTEGQPSEDGIVSKRELQELQKTVKSLKFDLKKESSAAEKLAKEFQDQKRILRTEADSWKEKYNILDHEKRIAEKSSIHKISSLKFQLSVLEKGLQQGQFESTAQKASLLELEATKKRLETELQQSTAQLRIIQSERFEVNTQNETLSSELEDCRTKIERLEKDNTVLKGELAEKSKSLQVQRNRVAELTQHMLRLEESEANLKQAIAASWLRKLYCWFTGSTLM
ncbi:Uncharacterized protein LW93_15046 [Fusarium fujikuroi]|nr:Uncharacterized protein LW93_15046 [Fusarium fujikuroi]SCV30781.1 uncharacterized protein FFB14_03222 [Fusarium fujikuroi]